MIIVDFVASIIAPIIISLYDYFLARVNITKIIGKNRESSKYKKSIYMSLLKVFHQHLLETQYGDSLMEYMT